ncbi:NUDIX hydrolase [Alsobacter sp. SYSU BS001988]|jgi:ADP-ribose pyrophosphatase YjhB (NUDIX family)
MAASTSEPAEAESRLYPSRPFLAASVAVFRDGKVLLATRTKPPSAALFSLPGGLVEPGETLEEAALRELEEEVGCAAKIAGFVRHSQVIERDGAGRVLRHFVIATFAARWVSGEPAPGPEAGAVLFADPQDIAALPTTRGLGEVVDLAWRVLGGADAGASP